MTDVTDGDSPLILLRVTADQAASEASRRNARLAGLERYWVDLEGDDGDWLIELREDLSPSFWRRFLATLVEVFTVPFGFLLALFGVDLQSAEKPNYRVLERIHTADTGSVEEPA